MADKEAAELQALEDAKAEEELVRRIERAKQDQAEKDETFVTQQD